MQPSRLALDRTEDIDCALLRIKQHGTLEVAGLCAAVAFLIG